METKNICGKIPVELHEKVREELEGTEMTIPQFLQKVIEEHFMKKGVEKMEAKTLAVQVSEELFNRLKERVEKEKRQRRGRFTQKDYLAAPAGAAADDGNSSSDPAASAAQSSAARPNVFQNAAVSCFSFTHSPPIGGHCTTSAPICASRRAVLRKCEEIFAQTIDFFPLHLV